MTQEKMQQDHWRLKHHIMPETGWLNDPNGAIQFDGLYHLYHQYVPENPNGGATHWGHLTSHDLVTFKQEEIFMSPDQPFDKDGVYSGSAIEHDGKIHYFYTGNVKREGDHDYIFSGREQNVVHVVSQDGFNIDRREVVIPHDNFPKGYSDHIRDPKVFERSGQFYMVLGARSEENLGSILVYSSADLDVWSFHGTLLEGNEEQGYMWECPDFFDLEDTSVLIFSPQGILPEAYKYNNSHAAVYWLGTTDWSQVKFKPAGDFQELDRGFDFYAPQTFVDEQGRRIMWAWMGLGDTMPEYTNPTIARGWQHAMAMPRELVLEEGRLYQKPLVEYQKLRQNETVRSIKQATDLAGEVYELMVEFESSEAFQITLRQDTQLLYDGKILTFQHGKSGYGRRKRMTPVGEIHQLQIFVDTSSIEIFVNDGAGVLTSRMYPVEGADTIQIDSQAEGTVTYWELY